MLEEIINQTFLDRMSRDWKDICQKCGGGCCKSYPLPSELFERFGDRVQVPTELYVLDDEYIMPMTPDHGCPFLGRHDRMCVIYEDRPMICRLFGEIPELPCPELEPEKAEWNFKEMVERISARLGLPIKVGRKSQ